MKKYAYSLVIIFVFAVAYTACNEEDFSSKEYYRYLIYMLSKEDHNVYTVSHPYTEDEDETIGYFSIGCSGSQSNPEEITIVLGSDDILLDKYNLAINGTDSSRYARLLSPDRYHISAMTIEFPAQHKDQYVKVPVYVNSNGLSPDTTYFIPIAIKSARSPSGVFEVNPDKHNMLYRVVVENYYAEQNRNTIYSLRGDELEVDAKNDSTTQIVILDGEVLKLVYAPFYVETRVIKPLSKNSLRVIAGKESVAKMAEPTLEELKKKAIILTIADNGSVKISPYGNIQVQQIDGPQIDETPWNIYREERKNMVDETVNKYFYLRYRYRTLLNQTIYSDWTYVEERLKRDE